MVEGVWRLTKAEFGGLREIGEAPRQECVDIGQCFSSRRQVSRKASQMKAQTADERAKADAFFSTFIPCGVMALGVGFHSNQVPQQLIGIEVYTQDGIKFGIFSQEKKKF